jgi:hypothetical protein
VPLHRSFCDAGSYGLYYNCDRFSCDGGDCPTFFCDEDVVEVTEPCEFCASTTTVAASSAMNCVGSWGAWSSCTATCGGSNVQRTFTITTAASNGGTACSDTNGATESQACNTQACPVNCVGSWGAWASSCTATCGGSNIPRTFTITTAASNGGAACSSTNGAAETKTCNSQACPVNCVGSWGAWASSCTATCGGAAIPRTFAVTTAAANGGTACVASAGAVDLQQCNTHACPGDCDGEWGAWSSVCTATCGGSTLSRTYKIISPASSGGTACVANDNAVDYFQCNTQSCPIDCNGEWLTWSDCGVTCGGGTAERTYAIYSQASSGGQGCLAQSGAVDTTSCATTECTTAPDCEEDMTLCLRLRRFVTTSDVRVCSGGMRVRSLCAWVGEQQH